MGAYLVFCEGLLNLVATHRAQDTLRELGPGAVMCAEEEDAQGVRYGASACLNLLFWVGRQTRME